MNSKHVAKAELFIDSKKMECKVREFHVRYVADDQLAEMIAIVETSEDIVKFKDKCTRRPASILVNDSTNTARMLFTGTCQSVKEHNNSEIHIVITAYKIEART